MATRVTHFVVWLCAVLDVTSDFRRGPASARVGKRDYLRNIKDEQTPVWVMQQSLSADCRRVTRAPTLWQSFAHKSSVSVRARAQRVPPRVPSWASLRVPELRCVCARASVSVSPRRFYRSARAPALSHGRRRYGSARAAVRANSGEFTAKLYTKPLTGPLTQTRARARMHAGDSCFFRSVSIYLFSFIVFFNVLSHLNIHFLIILLFIILSFLFAQLFCI